MNPVKIFKAYAARRRMKRKGLIGGRRKVEPGLLDKCENFVRRTKIVTLIVTLSVLIVSMFLIGVQDHYPEAGDLISGQNASKNIYAAFDFSYKGKSYEKWELLVEQGPVGSKSELFEQYCKELSRRKAEQKDWNIRIFLVIRNLLFVLVLLIVCKIFLHFLHPLLFRSDSIVLQSGLIVVLALLLNIAVLHAGSYLFEEFPVTPVLCFLVLPIGYVSMVLAPVAGGRSAIIGGFFVSMLSSIAVGGYFSPFFIGVTITSAVTWALSRTTNYRSYFIRGLFTVFFVNLFSGCLLRLLHPEATFYGTGMKWFLILSAGSALFTAFFSQISLYFLEALGVCTSNMSLLLYSDYNHPLLKRLQFEAPGTYHHSLLVSTLAEAAAKEIGANPILARVQALFHDVGKLAQPEYFTENNNGENLHRDLTPKLSSLIILNHVKEGLLLARKYKLRKLLRDAISQHHGTDLVYYFYKRAKDAGGLVDEHDFRYEGPKPQTKEIAILSLADACEAAARSIEKPTHSKIEEMVTEIFNKRLRDGQLDDSQITFRELTAVRKCFIRLLTTMHHARIAYPKEEKKDEIDLFMDAAAKKASENKTA